MLKIEFREMFRSNGLIDDFVFYGKPNDYIELAQQVEHVVTSDESVIIETLSEFLIEINCVEKQSELFVSLQNKDNEYYSMESWKARNILRVVGNRHVLDELRLFLIDLSGRGKGYSYISEYSDTNNYSDSSPECRLHIEL